MNQPNPYQPPAQGDQGPALPADEAPYPTSLGRRFGNFFIDGVLLGVVSAALGYLIAVSGAYFFGLGYAQQVLAYVFVYVFPEAMFGRTFGKLCTGTKVVNMQGGKPTLGQVLIRTIVRWVPFEPLSFLWGDNSGWHDQWSKTLVVPTRDPYADIV